MALELTRDGEVAFWWAQANELATVLPGSNAAVPMKSHYATLALFTSPSAIVPASATEGRATVQATLPSLPTVGRSKQFGTLFAFGLPDLGLGKNFGILQTFTQDDRRT
jgi:hypothetical protein